MPHRLGGVFGNTFRDREESRGSIFRWEYEVEVSPIKPLRSDCGDGLGGLLIPNRLPEKKHLLCNSSIFARSFRQGVCQSVF